MELDAKRDVEPVNVNDPGVPNDWTVGLPEDPGGGASLPTSIGTGKDVLHPLDSGEVLHYFPNDPMVRARPEHPARRLPKYIPDIDGGYWKCWDDPMIVELNTDSEVEGDEPVPMSTLLDPREKKGKIFDDDTIKIPIIRFFTKSFAWILFLINSFAIGKILYNVWQTYLNKHQKLSAVYDSDDDEEY